MELIKALKKLIFAETDDAGKVCQVRWVSDVECVATALVPIKAYNRFQKRATLRAIRGRVPTAKKIRDIKKERGTYNGSNGERNVYYLVRATFRASK